MTYVLICVIDLTDLSTDVPFIELIVGSMYLKTRISDQLVLWLP